MDIYKTSLILSIIGLIIALYLVIEVYTNIPIACPGNGVIDCTKVIHSAYSLLFGVPLADYGLVFFMIETLVIKMRNKDAFLICSILGLATVPYLVYLEHLIGAICIYCTADHIIILTLVILAILNLRSKE